MSSFEMTYTWWSN